MGFLDPLIDASVPHTLPLASSFAVAVISVGYLVAMAVTTFFAPRPPLELRWLSLGHNTFLCLYSLYSFIGFVSTLAANYSATTTSAATLFFCDSKHELVGGDMNYWLYHFYLSK